MYKKYLVVVSKKDKAGMNIVGQLQQFRQNPVLSSMGEKPNFDIYFVEGEIIFTENLDLKKINNYDFIIFASKHKSEKQEKSLSIHPIGNWRLAELGGVAGKVSKTSAAFLKQIFEKLHETVKSYEVTDYNITMECTHHGPLIEKPSLFIEVGSTEEEWADRRATFILAKTIADTIYSFKENPYNEIAIAIGGPHYCPNFNKLQEKSNIAISHIIPSYVLPLSEEMVKEAISKTEEEIDFAVLDWKGLGNADQRDQALKILDKLYIRHKKTSEINKD